MTGRERRGPRRRTLLKWATIAAFLGGCALAFDAATKALGVWSAINEWLSKPSPRVAVTKKKAPWNGDCLRFAFERLTKDFSLGSIQLTIVEAVGPNAIPGDQTTKIERVQVGGIVQTAIFSEMQPKPIAFDVAQQATKENDNLYVTYCPTLDRAGFTGTLTVKPKFLTPTGADVRPLKVILPAPDTDKNTDKISFSVSRPKSIDPETVTPQMKKE